LALEAIEVHREVLFDQLRQRLPVLNALLIRRAAQMQDREGHDSCDDYKRCPPTRCVRVGVAWPPPWAGSQRPFVAPKRRRSAHMRPRLVASLVLVCLLVGQQTAAQAAPPADVLEQGTLNGAAFKIEVPANWNGTLALYSHGYVTP